MMMMIISLTTTRLKRCINYKLNDNNDDDHHEDMEKHLYRKISRSFVAVVVVVVEKNG